MSLTVGFDATAAARQRAGIGRYTRELLKALAVRNDQHDFRLYYCGSGTLDGHVPELGRRFRVRALPVSDRIMNGLWYRAQVPLPVQIITGAFDLFHSPDFTAPPTFGKPAVITIHDLAFLRTPECAYPTLRSYLERVVPRAARRATHLIAVSENTRRDLLELLDLAPEKITTIPEGVSPNFKPPTDRDAAADRVASLGVLGPYILSVGTLEPRKNYVRLLEAYALLRRRGLSHRLVIGGGRGWLYKPIFDRLRELRLEDDVTFLVPGDEALSALYGMADAFVYPSLYEGFGIPPLEALACGTPVACSNTSSLPEVVGDAGLTFDPRDVEAMAGAIERLLENDALRATLRQKGLARASQFTWDLAAGETIRVYQELANGA